MGTSNIPRSVFNDMFLNRRDKFWRQVFPVQGNVEKDRRYPELSHRIHPGLVRGFARPTSIGSAPANNIPTLLPVHHRAELLEGEAGNPAPMPRTAAEPNVRPRVIYDRNSSTSTYYSHE